MKNLLETLKRNPETLIYLNNIHINDELLIELNKHLTPEELAELIGILSVDQLMLLLDINVDIIKYVDIDINSEDEHVLVLKIVEHDYKLLKNIRGEFSFELMKQIIAINTEALTMFSNIHENVIKHCIDVGIDVIYYINKSEFLTDGVRNGLLSIAINHIASSDVTTKFIIEPTVEDNADKF